MGALDANAATLTLTNAQIQLGQPPWVATNNVGGTTTQVHLVNSNQFTSFFDGLYSAPPAAIATWTLDVNIVAGAADTFALEFLNSNANVWDFQLEIVTTAAVTVTSAFVPLAPNVSSVLSVVVPAGATIDLVRVRVRGSIPLGPDNDDRTANFNVYSAPEPGSLLLLGLGLTSLALLRRRK
jgi:hypothetical protein